MGSLLCSLLHHALALLLCSLLCGQLEECETHLSQLQIYPWSLQGWSLGSGSLPVMFVRNFCVTTYNQQQEPQQKQCREFLMHVQQIKTPPEYHIYKPLLLGHWYEIIALYYVKSILTEISASRQDRRVLQKSKIIRIEFLSKWGMLQTSRYV